MARKSYTPEELLALRGLTSEWPLEHRLINRVEKDPAVAHVLRVRPMASLSNGIDRGISEHNASTESEEPIRQQLDGQDVEWKLQGRNSVDAQSPNPLTAPHEMKAQMNEGFKRFYKAVVSPNNIRVTAGGRIVPNTLANSSPTGKGKDKAVGESSVHMPVQGHPNYSASSNGGVAGNRRDSLFSPSLIPRSPRRMSAAPFPMPGYPFSAASAVPGPVNVPLNSDANNIGGNGCDKNAPGPSFEQPPAPKPAGINVSGHYMGHAFIPGMPGMPMSVQMPMPMGMHMPMPMMPSHPSMIGYPGSPMGTLSPHMGTFSPLYGPMPFSGHLPHPMPMSIPGLVHPCSNLMGGPHGPLNTPSAPPASSIRMSDVTKKHIENMRLQLKWVEDQLQFNKHQVDEREMKQQAEVIRQQIQELDANLKSQLDDEARQSRTGSKSASANPSFRELAVQAPFDCNRGDDSACATTSAFVLHNPSTIPEPAKKRSALPITAALAPPFKPRGQYGQGLLHSTSVESFKYTNSSKMNEEERLVREQRLLAAGMQYPPIPPEFEAMSARLTGATQRMPENEVDASADTQLSSQENLQEPLAQLNDGLGRPYLEGKLRPGVDARNAKDQDYVYHRPLTDEEIRARHLYWGNAPRSVQKGLPKYDGRNFYPASPVKEMKSPNTDSNHTCLPAGHLDDYGYKSQTTVPGPNPDPFAQETMKGLLALHLRKSKRQTQSDNVNGSQSRRKEMIRIRPTTSLISKEETSDSDAHDVAEESPAGQSPRRSTQPSDSDESHEIVFNGRRSMQRSSRSGLWQTMGKINAGSVNALPGAMSSTTAHGLMRQYAGSAAASLTPAMATVAASTVSLRTSPVKFQSQEETTGAALFGDKRENKSPLGRRGIRRMVQRG
ncbi:hypothetical protein SODALDRAFT_319890 [Sodiomyces alkalinus F11]|uniref:Uncharacterized protein n=1 Tax=Sodiomyces alkalinus (strain CBS 110278 / VKM F-3762 / F11) TaxID=1314773 RepID=A0A3N2Q9I2_SODAK|nr:hypothetical protein SODALDRAFT_319890 [Sodiomyces alkalinus F11]ROT43423.1 hypothetical protein SODALDRAFT_319890 [Sodiomyces alkalinus F11]